MDRETFVKEKTELAAAYFCQGYNCCQAVLLSFRELTSLREDALASAGAGLGGGVGRMREVCGSVSAMGILAGFISPVPLGDREAKRNTYALVQTLAGEFKARNGSIVCRDLLGLKAEAEHDPRPAERTAEYYHSRPCERMVRSSAGILAAYVYDNVKP